MLAARGLAGLASAGRPALGTALVVICLVAGLPTTAIDAYNAQDVGTAAWARVISSGRSR